MSRRKYVVIWQWWDDYELVSVHDTKESAYRVVKRLNKKAHHHSHRYEEVKYVSRKREKKKSR